MRALTATLFTALLLAVPMVARACPSCADDEKGGIATGIIIGAMIGLPFAVAGIVYRVIRRGYQD